MDAYFQWLRDKRQPQTLDTAPPGAGHAPAPRPPDSPGIGFPVPARAFALLPTANLGFFALFAPAFLPGYAWGGSQTLSPSTMGHFSCCLSIL
jgi:hypothetical protein